jgi:hypothetical protein
MNNVFCIKAALLLIVIFTFVGCKSKQEAPGANPAPQLPIAGEIKIISGQNTAGNLATSPQDKSDAQAAADRVLSQFLAGEYSAIYNAATPGFKKIGTEADFVAKFQQTRQKIGILKNPKETSFVTRPDNAHVLNYRLENEQYKTDLRLTFARSQSGKMELDGLNQHDELNK